MSGPTRGAVLRSELTKLLTLRSVVVTLVLAVTVPVALAALTAPAVRDALATDDPALAPGVTPAGVGMEYVALGQIALVVVGVLAASSEYRGGQLLVSLTAVPARGRLLAAKSLALALVSVVVAALAVPAMSLVSQSLLGELSVIDDGVPSQLVLRWVGAVFYWVAMAQLGLALAVVSRSALLPLVVLIVVSQLSIMLVVMTSWSKLLPTVAGVQLFDPASITASFPDATLSTGTAAVVVAAWVVGLLVLAFLLFRKRGVRA